MYRVMLKALDGAEWQYHEEIYPTYKDARAQAENAAIDYPDCAWWIEVQQVSWAVAHA